MIGYCGNVFVSAEMKRLPLGKSLRAGLVMSCGCLHSKGEEKISKILREMKIDYISQYHTDELKNDNNYFLYFDFFFQILMWLLNIKVNNTILLSIEAIMIMIPS